MLISCTKGSKKKINGCKSLKKDKFTRMKKVGILGCGWLGKAIAKELIKEQFLVYGSVQKKQNIEVLKEMKINPFVISIENNRIVGDLNSFLDLVDIIVIAFPPGIKKDANANYLIRINHLIGSLSKKKKIIFLSSVGVFGSAQGIVNENTTPVPDSNLGEQLFMAEKAVLSINNDKTIIRLGGLVGPGRHPAKMLAGKVNIHSPNALTNLVHQHDVSRFIVSQLNGGHWNMILHCVSPVHHQRSIFYIAECAKNKLRAPKFSNEPSKRNKKIMDTKSGKIFSFKYNLVSCRVEDC
jgi:nucleoside-diphosphate-sugar epimerase